MLEIQINSEPLDLPSGFSVEMEDSNPIFNDRGSQSIPATVPATGRNSRLLKFPSRIDTGVDPNQPEQVAVFSDGAYIRRGMINITGAGRDEGITFNVGFDNSTAYNQWSEKKLSELADLPVVSGPDLGYKTGVDGLIEYLEQLYKAGDSQRDPLAVFTIYVGKESGEGASGNVTRFELLNVPTYDGSLVQPTKIHRIVDGKDSEVTVPAGYCLTAFVRVWRLIELAFADLGVSIDENIFRTDIELSRLVVLNNAADALCTGRLNYSDLMPDCTVGEFMNALWVRFGLVYNINFDTRRGSIKLLRDIIKDQATREIVSLTTAPELVNYTSPQYVKLSAKTSLDGAAPAAERFEDFIKGLDVRSVKLGNSVSSWEYDDRTQSWDRDVSDSYWDYYDDDPDDDDRDDDNRDDDDRYDDRDLDQSQSRASTRQSVPAQSATFLAREFVTGTWYKLDTTNGTVCESSSGFFTWNPASPGLVALELSSDDECVPIVRISSHIDYDHSFSGYCPAYLTGSRHYHSYIKGNDSSDESGVNTPLAFMIAYTFDGKTIGRLNAENSDGQPLSMNDGTHPTLSLLFQFKDGLFARFWKEYDEILRHGNRSVEVPVRIGKPEYLSIDLLTPVTFRGVRCLIDTFNYSLPSGKKIGGDMKLRPITTQGDYDIKAEQNIPDFAAAARHLEWFAKNDGYNEAMLYLSSSLNAAVEKFKLDTGYQNHGIEGDWYAVTPEHSAIPVNIWRYGLTWETDQGKTKPGRAGEKLTKTYQALLIYDIFECHYMNRQGEEDDWELDELPLGRVSVIVDYTVELVARWVRD